MTTRLARRAFQASERARARTLLDLLKEAEAGLRKDVAPDLEERRSLLQLRINAKATSLTKHLEHGRQNEAEAAEVELYRLTSG